MKLRKILQKIKEKFIKPKSELVSITYQENTLEWKLRKLQATYNKNVNIFIGEELDERTKEIFFGKEKHIDDGSITVHYKGDPWLTTIMRDIGVFKSTSEAKGAGWHRKAEYGFSDQIINLKNGRPHRICIYKETKQNAQNQRKNNNIHTTS